MLAEEKKRLLHSFGDRAAFHEIERMLYSRDLGNQPHFVEGQMNNIPEAVVQPNSIHDLRTLIDLAAQYKTPLVPRGTGTGMISGPGDPRDTTGGPGDNVSYWGRLSFGINEDIAGSTFHESDSGPVSRWVVLASGRREWVRGEVHPRSLGTADRLEGRLDRVWDPASVER